MPKPLDGTVYIHVVEGKVDSVLASAEFDARIDVEVWDFTPGQEGMDDCHGDNLPHTHGLTQLGRPEGTISDVLASLMDKATQSHRECEITSDVECHADGYGDGNVGEHKELREFGIVIADHLEELASTE